MGIPNITLLINISLLFVALSIVVYTAITGISPAPSSRKATRKILDAIPADIEGKIVDLGSGWGTLVFPLARAFPSSEVIGYELSPAPWLFSRLWASLSPRNNLQLHRKNFFNERLTDASVIVCFLHPSAMTRLGPKLEKELRPGTLIITNTFGVPSWTPEQVHHLRGILSKTIYVYKVQTSP